MARKRFSHNDYALKIECFRGDIIACRLKKRRILILSGIAFLWVALIMWRLVGLQITQVAYWQEWALKQHLAEVKLSSERGPVFDRRGQLLAVSVPAGSVYARPAALVDKAKTARELSKILQFSEREIQEKLSKRSPFVWIERQVPRAIAQKVQDLKLPGVGYLLESRRYYPFNEAGSALIGKVGIDGLGLSGLELKYESWLHSDEISSKAKRDALGNVIHEVSSSSKDFEIPRGNALTLTIDSSLQLILDEELVSAKEKTRAKATLGVLIDAERGDVLALGQAPSVNFNLQRGNSADDLKNLVAETVFEPGSIMKPIVAAAALEEKLVRPSELIDCGSGKFKIGRHTIKDVHPYDKLTLSEVIVRSSNIGMSRVGIRLGRDRLYGYLERFGFASSTGLELPGITSGILRKPASWAAVDEATHAFGHGMAVTPLQVVRAVSAIANGGYLPTLSIVKGPLSGSPEQIISREVAGRVKEMMYEVVEDKKGTGQKAAIEGVRVGGKTGTAQKVRAGGRGYKEGAYVASFVGFADGRPLGVNQTLALIIIVDEPNTDSIYGGVLAAPVFQKVMSRSLQALSLQARLETPRGGATHTSRKLLPVSFKPKNGIGL